jgi:hypothetical protein
MRRAILILGLLLGACGGDDAVGGGDMPMEVEPLEIPDMDYECDGMDPVDSLTLYDGLLERMDDGCVIQEESGCWVGVEGSCGMLGVISGHCGDDDLCVQVSFQELCAVGLAVICENENAPGCETPEAINDRADATIAAICG